MQIPLVAKAYLSKRKMAGIYVHIPFCKQACHYCNFHFSTSLKSKDILLSAIHQEMAHRQMYLENREVETVYLGGGTPSLLETNELNALFRGIREKFHLTTDAEITLEANPDDMTDEKIRDWKALGVNRLSVGVQSFNALDLAFMNRTHSAQQAEEALKLAQAHGFEALSVDLIYGSPTTTHQTWRDNLAKTRDLGIDHLSCYALTVEPNTALQHMVRTGKSEPVDDAHASHQFGYLQIFAEANAFEHYEISNLARNRQYSRHNRNYWSGKWYLGLGPSAHSFNGRSRSWNIAHNQKYIQAMSEGADQAAMEVISPTARYNEFVMTGLRTQWGCSVQQLRKMGEEFLKFFECEAQKQISSGTILFDGASYRLAADARFFADGISSDLFLIE